MFKTKLIVFINSPVDDPVERLITLALGNAEKEVNSTCTYVHVVVIISPN